MRTNLIKSKLPPEEDVIKANSKPQSKEKYLVHQRMVY